jgi:hypothetical protein
MPKKKDPSPPPPPPPDDEYSIGSPEGDDFEEETDDEKIKEELLQKYKAGKIGLIEEMPPMDNLPQGSSEYPIGSSVQDSYFPPETRMMPSQLQMKYLLQPDDVPNTINKKLWAIVSRHLELINIESINEIPYYQRDVRQIIRVASWDWDMRDIAFADMQQVEFYAVQVLLKKSIRHGERLALMTTIQRSQVEEYAERSPGMGGGGGGFVGAIRNFFGGRR